jgi:hypothetical protein
MSDYYVFTSRRNELRNAWYWEIRRHSAPMGVLVTEGGMPSEQAAVIAGQRALDEFLAALDEEERRVRQQDQPGPPPRHWPAAG